MASRTNGFYEYLPKGYESGTQTYPVIIFMHGIGEIGNGSSAALPAVLRNGTPKQIAQGIFPDSFVVNGQSFKFIVISPQFTQIPWGLDIDNIITYAIRNYRVDPTRVYLTGLSMGGGIVWDYASYSADYASRVAAIVPIAGASTPNSYKCNVLAASNVPVWATHNIGDPTVTVTNTTGYVLGMNTNLPLPNPLAKQTLFVGTGHDAWTQTYNFSFTENGMNVYQWMLQYKRNFTNVWTGAVSAVWENTANWSLNKLPDATTDVLINSGAVVVRSNPSIHSLTVKPGVNFTVTTGYKLTLVK